MVGWPGVWGKGPWSKAWGLACFPTHYPFTLKLYVKEYYQVLVLIIYFREKHLSIIQSSLVDLSNIVTIPLPCSYFQIMSTKIPTRLDSYKAPEPHTRLALIALVPQHTPHSKIVFNTFAHSFPVIINQIMYLISQSPLTDKKYRSC